MMTRGRLTRSREHRLVAGVAGGMAEWSGLPVALVRFLWLLAFLPGGIPGLLLYLICWVLIPREP
jgi:phage shock protein PspC (stress-responsive transcriptional regulator)